MSKKLQARKDKFKFEFTNITQEIKNLDPHRISEYTTSKKVQFNSKETFLMFFTGQIAQIYELTISECSILFEILHKYVGYSNLIYLSSDQKKIITNELEIDPGSISKALKTLREKEIIIASEDPRHDKLNPFLFGEDDFQTIALMETKITKKYNFKDLCVSIIESTVVNKENEFIDAIPTRRRTDNHDSVAALQYETNRELELRLQIYEAKLKLHGIGELSLNESTDTESK